MILLITLIDVAMYCKFVRFLATHGSVIVLWCLMSQLILDHSIFLGSKFHLMIYSTRMECLLQLTGFWNEIKSCKFQYVANRLSKLHTQFSRSLWQFSPFGKSHYEIHMMTQFRCISKFCHKFPTDQRHDNWNCKIDLPVKKVLNRLSFEFYIIDAFRPLNISHFMWWDGFKRNSCTNLTLETYARNAEKDLKSNCTKSLYYFTNFIFGF